MNYAFETIRAALSNGAMMQNTTDMDIVVDEGAYTLYVELPGVRKENVGIELREGLLSISVEKRDPACGMKKTQADRYFGSYQKNVCVGRGLDPNGITATMENGVLKVVIRKKEGQGARKIEIS